MCGIAGYASAKGATLPQLKAMGEALLHRGPDSHGEWRDEQVGLGFAHRRLAIVDLSEHGHQPMASADGRFVLSFNGEIYNHGDLRKMLEEKGQLPEGGWRGHSDTETFLEAVSHWGLDAAIEASVGMFAFTLFDRRTRTLSLVRDRFGEKPLYYGWCGKDFVFASELKAIRTHPDFDAAIEPRAMASYVAKANVGGPWSINRGCFKLLPGCRLDVDLSNGPPPPSVDPISVGTKSGGMAMTRYWDYRDVVLSGMENRISDEGEALDAIEASLKTAISGQAMADVPVGAFLSGGVDSSMIVALYQKVSNQQVKTFTIGFDEAEYDESEHAKAVADHLGTAHEKLDVRVADAMAVIPDLPKIWDEPFADASQVPTYLVSKLARQRVTVSLSGDGGDELFGGYQRHYLAPKMWRLLSTIPYPLRRSFLPFAGLVPVSMLAKMAALGGFKVPLDEPEKIKKFVSMAAKARDFSLVSDSFVDDWFNLSSPLANPIHPPLEDRSLPEGTDTLTRITYRDAIEYMPDDILVKVDRAGMAVSLEGRIPFLDHRVAATAARIDPSLKVKGGQGKAILRDLLGHHVPRAITERPKSGFGIPLGHWIKDPLRDWAEDLLDENRLREGGIFDPKVVRKRWRDHVSGRRRSDSALWSILMFEAWRREQGA